MKEEKKFSFEQAMEELEQIVAQLESGATDMDKSFALYERGVKLTKFCESYLDEKQKLLSPEEKV